MTEVVRAIPSSGKLAVAGQPEGNLPTDTIHVLLVDDERLSRVVVGNLLRKCNYKGRILAVDAQRKLVLQIRRCDV